MTIAETPVHAAPFTGPGAWRRADFPDPGAWTYRLTDFSLSWFASEAARLRREINCGRGFVVIKGLPVERYSERECAAIYSRIGALLGTTLPQNVRGDLLYSVRDEGYNIDRDWGAVGVRFSKTTEGLHFHTDSAPALMGNTPDIVGLLALRVAKFGGASALVSAQSIHNVIVRQRPDLLARLYRGYHFDRRAELRPGESSTLFAPIFTYRDSLAVRYFRFYIPNGHELAGAPLADPDIEALDFFEAVMNREEWQVTFDMEPGDMQFVSNNFVLHSRTAYEDHPEPERRRHFIRLWLKAS